MLSSTTRVIRVPRAAASVGAFARQLASKAETVKAFEADQKLLSEAMDGDFTKALKDPAVVAAVEKVKGIDASMGWTFARACSAPGAKPPMTVGVTGAGTAAGAEALFRIAAGEMLGGSQAITLQVAGADAALVKELQDCAFPLLKSVTAASSPAAALKGATVAIVLEGDFAAAGKALGADAIVGVSGVTNAAAVAASAPAGASVTAITRVLQAGAEQQIAAKVGCSASSVSRVTVWGNDAIDLSSATIEGKWALDVVGDWAPTAAEPEPAVAADAIVSHMKDLCVGSEGEWSSMGVPATGDYGLGEGFFYSVPVTCPGGGLVKRVGGIPITPALAETMEAQRVALAK